MRRSHYKSRKGCRQCKQRHVKCDEQQPSCLQCSMTARTCSYLGTRAGAGAGDEHASLRPPSLAESAGPTPGPDMVAPLNISTANSPPDTDVQEAPRQVFDLSHLALLHHVENDMMKEDFFAGKENAKELLQMIITSALGAPYLMDALLAFAALHRSVFASDPDMQHRYHYQAVQLQTRALTLYNTASPEITDETCTALLLYSSFIGMHMLHDTVTSRSDFLETLDGFIQFAGLYHGVGLVAKHAWHILRKSELSSIINLIEAADRVEPPSESICDHLSSLLTTADDRLRPSSLQACHDSVKSLRWIFNQRVVLPTPVSRDVVLAWPVHMSTEYLQLLRERLPEALVIMAYWAILLHYERDFWVFGQAGRFLIEAISNYLGSAWDKWMVIPKEIINLDSTQMT
ncbi:putative C6 finger domain-containing protein [Rosellinia necatrix]|uniref:Putative C6 finger domain-containing protein n=1 Tax=Rosellinia necatrix TaxID=77044 RepID=A0A1W2TT95_ROSNE|nr:putative C6 finger domain-containing protein [Rosellinia necatrix]